MSKSWTRRGGAEEVYERGLGLNELQFYYRSTVLHGCTDLVQSVAFDALDTNISESTVAQAWISIKQRNPLLGAYFDKLGPSDDDLRFVVDQNRLRTCRVGEIVWESVRSEEEAYAYLDTVLNAKRILNDDHLTQLFVLKRSDCEGRYHLAIHAAHAIIDGISFFAVVRALLDSLANGIFESADSLPARLALCPCAEDLFPMKKQTLARQRWRRAMANVINSIRARSMNGGYTLPGNFTANMVLRPTKSSIVWVDLTHEQSSAVGMTCRKHGLTFGNAYPIIGQVAMARVLARRYARGEISEEEWQFRQREPIWDAGPINQRPLLNPEWYRAGGADVAMINIAFFFLRLPFTPLHLNADKYIPSYGELLPTPRFFHRAKTMRAQAAAYFNHPLYLELNAGGMPARIEGTKALSSSMKSPPPDRPVSALERSRNGLVMGMGGSSLGRIDGLLPTSYPAQNPKILVDSVHTRLRCQPGEVYLGASSYKGIMRLNVFWDENVTSREVVAEWLSEIKDATTYYLGNEQETLAKL
ncbi:hypothetical protein CYLTODRAFT_64297 [Cylindrobasidium torrendii FP15055 ss-10]|uniref:CoA-dependent acyltransferase n=1 Tax=Cylindrobasidium torrendii FP15055 ss-10 TaxID=1314674 RepID=A0A0D7BPS9_9AGAR|nr:hypothetical protein CYLTODRAFT_64297 [Cylindrobasidium torrendii FP15055 ss-10]